MESDARRSFVKIKGYFTKNFHIKNAIDAVYCISPFSTLVWFSRFYYSGGCNYGPLMPDIRRKSVIL